MFIGIHLGLLFDKHKKILDELWKEQTKESMWLET